MSAFSITCASAAELPDIIAIQQKTWWTTYEPIIGREQCDYMFSQQYSLPSLLHQMETLRHQFLILKVNGEPAGFSSFGQSDETNVFKLHKLYIAPGTQQTGAGRQLLHETEQAVLRQGGRELRLNVNRNNPAVEFYKKMGYSVLYSEDIPYGRFLLNDYVMGRTLTSGQTSE